MPFIVEFHRQKAIPQKGRIRRTVEVLDGKEHAEWDIDFYMDILPGASSQRK